MTLLVRSVQALSPWLCASTLVGHFIRCLLSVDFLSLTGSITLIFGMRQMTPEAWMRSLEVQFKPPRRPCRLHMLQMAMELRGPLAPSLAYDYSQARWYRYTDGNWAGTTEASVTETIGYMLDVRFPDRWGHSHQRAFVGLLRVELACSGFGATGPVYAATYS